MRTRIQTFTRVGGYLALAAVSGCTDGSQGGHAPGGAAAGANSSGGAGGTAAGGAGAANGAGAATTAGVSNGGASAGAGGVDTPGVAPSACAGPLPEEKFGLSSGTTITAPGPYIVLTGTLPRDIAGSPVSSVLVHESARGVRLDRARKLWTFFLAAPGGLFPVTAKANSGASAPELDAQVSVGNATLPSRDVADGTHTVGTWMFSWFTGDTSWECSSAWRPVGGFKSWDGSVEWARGQLLDQLDAHLDAVGLQLDTPSATGTQGYRFTNIVHVLQASRALLEEGVYPPRLFPFLDTAIIADHYQASQGSKLDLSTEAGRAYFYGHANAFYAAAKTAFGSTWETTGAARFHGLPAVATWHSAAMTGVDNAAVLDFKARFSADFGSACYFIAHPNDWRNFDAVDEITQMVGPPTHFLKTGRDVGGFPTINVEAGFWNPTSNTFYLPREGGTHFSEAWASAQAERAAARHVWIDTWNETGEGSGMFAADPLSYTAADKGPCGQFVNTHAESWAAEGRHYIDVTRTQASAWNDAPELDAEPVASDVPATLHVGERRYVTVVMRNTGDAAWHAGAQQLGLTAAAAAGDFHLAGPVDAQEDDLTQRFGGVVRGLPGVFTVLLTAPCTPGKHPLKLQVYDAKQGAFGHEFSQDIDVIP